MNKSFFPIFAILLLLLSACSDEQTSVQAARPVPRPTQTQNIFSAPAATDSPLPPSTPEDIPAAVQLFTQALESGNSARLGVLFNTSVWVAMKNNETEGESLSRDAGVAWLGAHWSKPQVAESTYIRDGGLLSVATTGWLVTQPIEKGGILFNFHRYDSSGNMDELNGQWRIDTILYQ